MLNRKYELIFGQPVIFTNGVLKPSGLSPLGEATSRYIDTTGKSILINEHNISFSVTYKNTGDLSSAKISIFNPSQNTLNFIKTYSKQSVSVILRAGYGESFGTIFIGTVNTSSSKSEGITQVLELSCKDGEVQTKEAYTTRTFRKGTQLSDVFRELSSDMNLPLGALVLPTGMDKPIKKNLVFSGKTSEQLKKLAEDTEADVYINKGTIEIVPKYELTSFGMPLRSNKVVLPEETAVVISPSTGMIGSPVPLETGSDTKQKSKTNVSRLKVKALMLPNIRLGDLVTVESLVNDGATEGSVFKVIAIQHTGNYEGQDWTTTLDVESITGYKVVT